MQQFPLDARGVRRFLRSFWQNRFWLARGALPHLATAVDRARLLALACRDDVESRLVTRTGRNWHVAHGPFRKRDFLRLPPRNWTLLVNGVENFVPAARALQQGFGFVPYARQDDVMVSYAAPGGGVGPHYDSYDVFLLQGAGMRRWQISDQSDLTLVANAPLRILRHFRPQREWTLASGDVLYLPPDCAHHGVAVGECITWSIGFRAPGRQEMAARFLDYLQDHLQLEGRYRDRGLKLQRHPAQLGESMLRQVRSMVRSINWNDADIVRCLGEYLTEPRPNLVFSPPRRVSEERFAGLLAERGVQLDLKSRMLFGSGMIFVNGESVRPHDAAAGRTLRRLADARCLRALTLPGPRLLQQLYQWYCAGYIQLGDAPSATRERARE